MEPVVIIVKDIKNGKILLTEDELKTIVRRAYNDGYWEGKKTNWYGGITYTTASNTYPSINYDNTSGTPCTDPNIKITCDNDRNRINLNETFTCEAHNDIGG